MNVMPTSHLRLARIWVINRVIAPFHPKRYLERYSPIGLVVAGGLFPARVVLLISMG